MTRKTAYPIIGLLATALLVIWYLNRPTTYHVTNVAKRERFTVYSGGANAKPANVDLSVHGRIGAPFTLEVWAIPGRQPLFRQVFPAGTVTYDAKIDFYDGRGIGVDYLPSAATATGDLTIKARINVAF